MRTPTPLLSSHQHSCTYTLKLSHQSVPESLLYSKLVCDFPQSLRTTINPLLIRSFSFVYISGFPFHLHKVYVNFLLSCYTDLVSLTPSIFQSFHHSSVFHVPVVRDILKWKMSLTSHSVTTQNLSPLYTRQDVEFSQ